MSDSGKISMDWLLSALTVTALVAALLPQSSPSPLPDPVYIRNGSAPNQTIADLVQRQTDTIKKIVSNHHPDYPVITRHPPEHKKPDPHIPLDELKTKCQHLARLKSTTTPPPPTSGFYITTDPPATTPKPTPTPSPAPPVKFIKLEPVILQKTILSDGRTIYYWHKSIPSAVDVARAPPPTPPTTTTTAAPGYSFGNFFPSFYPIGGSESAATTTTEKTPAPDEMQLYQQQLKFVVPVPYAPPDESGVRKPWEIDQYAYYPKPLQPENINLQVPYVPTFHIIKAIAVPNEYEGAGKEPVM